MAPPNPDPHLSSSPLPSASSATADIINDAISAPLDGAVSRASPIELFRQSFDADYDASEGRLSTMSSPPRSASSSKRGAPPPSSPASMPPAFKRSNLRKSPKKRPGKNGRLMKAAAALALAATGDLVGPPARPSPSSVVDTAGKGDAQPKKSKGGGEKMIGYTPKSGFLSFLRCGAVGAGWGRRQDYE